LSRHLPRDLDRLDHPVGVDHPVVVGHSVVVGNPVGVDEVLSPAAS
jgi:hypothetical protein